MDILKNHTTGLYLLLGLISLVFALRWICSPTQEKNELAAAMPTPTDIIVTENSITGSATVSQNSAPATVVVQSSARSSDDLIEDDQSVLEDEIIICIAYTEHFRPTTYRCHGQRLIGYGQSRIDGVLVTDSMTITEREAQKEVRKLLRYNIIPKVKNLVNRDMTRGEIIACCLLAYNMGTGGFQNSAFLKAINNGESPEECIKHLKGKGGVGKRRWVDAAIFMGAFNAYDLLNLTAGGCYNFSNSFLYKNGIVDLSESTVEEFLTSELNQKGSKLMGII
ncbi:MAG: glycoside hydrolase family protein [Alphaproteobacteria bacterium]|nr:glycoside hydrolase family protein [Alphaproteobacteria bacterium]